MKKKLIIKTVVAVMMAVCLLMSFAVFAYAGAVAGSFYNTDPRYIGSTRVGYSEANFTGNYYSPGSSSNNAIIYAETKGGDVAIYTSELTVKMIGVASYYQSSANTGSSLLTYQMVQTSIPAGTNGYTEHHCYNTLSTSVRWDANYLYRWVNEQAGWAVY